MDQTDKRNALITRVAEKIFVQSAANWPSSQYHDLVLKAWSAGVAYADFMIDGKDAFKFNETETPELIDTLDDIDTRLMGLDEKLGVHMRQFMDIVQEGAERVVNALDRQGSKGPVDDAPREGQVV